MIPKKSIIKNKIPKWLGIEDIVFLAGATLPEVKILAGRYKESRPEVVFYDENELGITIRIRRDAAVENFDLFATGMADKLKNISWSQLLREEIDEYSVALMSVATKETLSRCNTLRQLSENKRISIANKRAEEDLVHASEVRAVFARFCAEACRVVDEVAEVLPSKVEGLGIDEIVQVMGEFSKKAKDRLKEAEMK